MLVKHLSLELWTAWFMVSLLSEEGIEIYLCLTIVLCSDKIQISFKDSPMSENLMNYERKLFHEMSKRLVEASHGDRNSSLYTSCSTMKAISII